MKCLLLKYILAYGLSMCSANGWKFLSAGPAENAQDLVIVCLKPNDQGINNFIVKDYFKENKCITIK